MLNHVADCLTIVKTAWSLLKKALGSPEPKRVGVQAKDSEVAMIRTRIRGQDVGFNLEHSQAFIEDTDIS